MSVVDAVDGSSTRHASAMDLGAFKGPTSLVADVAYWPIATEIHVAWHAGDQGKSGPVVLNVSFAACDP